MVELLAVEKRRLLAEGRDLRNLAACEFDEIWETCWEVMVLERGWPHATKHRRAWRQAQDETKEECLLAFRDAPSPFAFAARRIAEVAEGMCLRLAPEQVGKALLAAVAYVEVDDEHAAGRASVAASIFVAT
jgi:hypothetical protein